MLSYFSPLALLGALLLGCAVRSNTPAEPPDAGAPPPETAPEHPAVEQPAVEDPALEARLRAALAAKPPGYTPHTRHLDAQGRPRFTNRLILETSPYLLQHAHNPVSWFSWGDEAFERARRLGRPVLLSVGYSTCHWCHVMERESFEDLEIAAFINAHFVAIKVDREERPDVDDVYMTAVNLLTGRGGWPMTLVLTPDREPFFGGTYFPARDGDRGAGKGFLTLLGELSAQYAQDPGGVVRRARQISRRMKAAAEPARPTGVPGAAAITDTVATAAERFDDRWGGFGRAPKFPRPAALELLLRAHRRTGDAHALEMVELTLEKMARGGMYDQIGGGFHRYSTDARWLVPHFEKMLYDNAQLATVYLEAWQVTRRPELARIARETLDYVAREMTAPNGGFYSATDADSPSPSGHPEEGRFFTWTPAEIGAVVGSKRAAAVSAWYGVTPRGNFDGRSILTARRPFEEASPALREARQELYRARAKRPPPPTDDKILTAWNGLMITAFARGALVLDDAGYARRARAAASFVLTRMRAPDGRLLRSFKDGRARHAAVLEDYAFFTQGLLDLYEATSEPRWLREAIALQRHLDGRFADEAGGYFGTGDDNERLLVRPKPDYDGAEPSGNSIALLNLLRLATYTGDEAERQRAERGFAAFGGRLARNGFALPKMLCALDFYLDSPREVFVVTAPGQPDAPKLLAPLRAAFLPNRALTVTAEGDGLRAHQALIPGLEGKRARAGRATAYVCERGRCERPTSDPAVLARQLARVKPLL